MPAPPWLVRFDGAASVAVALLVLTQPGTDNLLTLLALLAVAWMIGGVLEVVDLSIDRWGRTWKLLCGAAGFLAGTVVLHESLWSTLTVPGTIARVLGGFGAAVALIRLLRAATGGGLGVAVMGAQSLALALVLLFVPTSALVGVGATVTTVGGICLLAVGAQLRLVEEAAQVGGERERERELT